MPLLRKARDLGEDAKVLSVLSPVDGVKLDFNDLGLKKNYSLKNASDFARVGNDLMVQVIAPRVTSEYI
jgi:hypothetical protein